MAIAEKIERFINQASWIRRMFEEGMEMKKLYGQENVYDFSLGNPDVPPPRRFYEELERVVAMDIPAKHSYMPNAGYPETRAALASHLSPVLSKDLKAEHIIMTIGAGGALNVIFKTILDPGDEVLTIAPCFVEYGFYVDNAGGVIKFVPSQPDFALDIGALEATVTPQTKAVLINSPNNPTGKVYDERSLRTLGEVLTRKSHAFGKTIYLVSDEPYRDIVYDGIKVPSVFSVYPETMIASSYSKTLSLAGERIGYIAVHPEIGGLRKIIDGLTLCNRMLGFVNAPALMQRVVARLQGVSVDVDVYRRKRDLLCDALTSLGYEVHKPEGAFYLFPKTPIEDDMAFVRALQKRRILTVPGSGFMGPGHFRIAYCVADSVIERAMEGFGETLREFC